MRLKKIAALAAIGFLLLGIAGFTPKLFTLPFISAGLAIEPDEAPMTVYNFQGKRLVPRWDKQTFTIFSVSRTAYAHAFFRPLRSDAQFETIIKASGIRRLSGAFIKENGKTYEQWTVNLMGQDIGAVRNLLGEKFPREFFNLEPFILEDKLTAKLYGLEDFTEHEKNSVTGKVFANVHFFEDVPQSKRDWIIGQYFNPEDIVTPKVRAEYRASRERYLQLAALDEVKFISEADTILRLTNNVARSLTKVNNVQVIDTSTSWPTTNWLSNLPYSNYYFGRNVNVGVYDNGIDTTPNMTTINDFKYRFSTSSFRTRRAIPSLNWDTGGNPSGTNDWVTVHGNHVAGIIGGNGWNSSTSGGSRFFWRGVAPKCLFISNGSWSGWDGHVNNHSHTSDVGVYNYADQIIDTLVRNHTTTHTMIYSAANNGVFAAPIYNTKEVGYFSILANTKNAIVVGATYKDTAAKAKFSSMGPTRDGRIKPDIVAPGGSYQYPERDIVPMRVEIDYIRIRHPNNVTAKAFEFNTNGNFEGWSSAGVGVYSSNHQVTGGNWSFDVHWLEDWLLNTSFTSYTSNANDTLIFRYRIRHYQIPSKLTKLRVGFGWNRPNTSYLGALDSLRLALPTPDTVNFQIAKFRLRDLRGQYSLSDATKGLARWDTGSTITVNELFFTLLSDTGDFVNSANAYDTTAPRYMQQEGTSMSAPHATGIAALLLEKWAKVVKPGANLDTQGPWNSTMKALMVHTATDLVKTKPDQWENPNIGDCANTVNPDLCRISGGVCAGNPIDSSFVRYYAGPDYATGYGLVNAEKALQYVDSNKIIQDSIRIAESRAYQFTLPAGQTKLRVTLAWDDIAGDYTRPIDESKLVNNLDLTIKDPNGKLYYPWFLNQLPQQIVGNQLPFDGIDTLASSDIQPAQKGVNNADNLEVADVEVTSGTLPAGTWKIIVNVTQFQAGNKQDFSIVSDYNITKLTKAIGWLMQNDSCPEGNGYIKLVDENPNNGSQSYIRTGTSGNFTDWGWGNWGYGIWIGPVGDQALGTQFRFCREYVDTLPQTNNPYAVIKMSNSCPTNGLSFARVSDNDNYFADLNWNSGGILPSKQSPDDTTTTPNGVTKMWFCYVKGNGGANDPPWKSRKQAAFANVNLAVNGGCDQMHWNIQDDEDTTNGNKYDWSQLATKTDSTAIKSNIFNNATTETHYFWNACP